GPRGGRPRSGRRRGCATTAAPPAATGGRVGTCGPSRRLRREGGGSALAPFLFFETELGGRRCPLAVLGQAGPPVASRLHAAEQGPDPPHEPVEDDVGWRHLEAADDVAELGLDVEHELGGLAHELPAVHETRLTE